MLDLNCSIEDSPYLANERHENSPEWGNVFTEWSLSVADGYAKGNIIPVVHIRLRCGEIEECNFCASFYRVSQPVNINRSAPRGYELYLPARGVTEDYIEQSVLVKVIEVSQDGQDRREVGVRSVVRLRSLNKCLSLPANAIHSPTPLLDTEGIGGITDRELKFPGIRRGIGTAILDSQCVNKMVQRGAQIPDAISGNKGPSIYRRILQDIDEKGVAATLSLTLSPDGMRTILLPRLQFGVESVEVFLCPAKF